MNRHKIISFLIIVGLIAGFLFIERQLLPLHLRPRISSPFPERKPSWERMQAMRAPEVSPEDEASSWSDEVVIVKRALEIPDSFALTDPLVETLIGTPKLKELPPLPHQVGKELFPKPRSIQAAVNFWKSIYAEYSTQHVVIHDKRHLDRVYAVLNFKGLQERGFSDQELYRFKKERVKEKMAEVDSILKYLDEIRGTAQPLRLAERKIWKMWEFLGDDPRRFAKAREELRSQTGLRNRFAEAVQRSGAYLAHMEEIFSEYHLPLELTRLVFVESLFRNVARSKVGAAGLWQIMPATGRLFNLKINEWVDERFDPLLATHAAAQLLRSNYRILGRWSLAVNAYNSGPGRLKRAVKKLGTKDIGVIINRYKGRGYGFASRNFYPEFLAALEVANNSRQIFGELLIELPVEYEVVRLSNRATFHELADIIRIDLESLRDLNPAFLPPAFDSDVYLPQDSTIRVPLGEGSRVIVGVYNLGRRRDAVTETEETL